MTGPAVLAAISLGACGSSSSSPPPGASTAASSIGQPALNLNITESGRTATISGASITQAGVVRVTLQNQGKSPHTLQFVLVEGNHTADEAYKVTSSNSDKTPPWLQALGGVSTTLPGQSNTAYVELPQGKYLLTEVGGPGSSTAPAKGTLSVSGGTTVGKLPTTSATVTAASAGSNRYQWQISGLHAGQNQFTFKSEGSQTLHFIAVVRLKPGQNPSLAEIQKQLSANGPPSFADVSSLQTTAILDGGRSQVATLNLQPGTYVFFCPLTDRNGGKPQFEEGLLAKYTVK